MLEEKVAKQIGLEHPLLLLSLGLGIPGSLPAALYFAMLFLSLFFWVLVTAFVVPFFHFQLRVIGSLLVIGWP